MIASFALWRVMAWNSGRWTWLGSEGRKLELRWQDKSSAVGWGVVTWDCWIICDSHALTLLALPRKINAISSFRAPSPDPTLPTL